MPLLTFTVWPHEDTTMLKSLTHMEMLLFYATTEMTILYISMLAICCNHKKSFIVL